MEVITEEARPRAARWGSNIQGPRGRTADDLSPRLASRELLNTKSLINIIEIQLVLR